MRNETKAFHRGRRGKIFTLAVALILLVGIVTGGTIAWLQDSSEVVTNTFTTSDINIELTESVPENKQAQIVPGYTISKDPKVTVKANSEKCYVFITVTETDWPAITEEDGSRKVDYDVISGENNWIPLQDFLSDVNTKVYYRVVDKNSTDQTFEVLVENCVTISGTLTKTEMNSITNGFTLGFQAFACQYYKNNESGSGTNQDATGTYFTAEEAWAIAKN